MSFWNRLNQKRYLTAQGEFRLAAFRAVLSGLMATATLALGGFLVIAQKDVLFGSILLLCGIFGIITFSIWLRALRFMKQAPGEEPIQLPETTRGK